MSYYLSYVYDFSTRTFALVYAMALFGNAVEVCETPSQNNNIFKGLNQSIRYLKDKQLH